MMLENNSITGFIPSQSQNIFFLENCMLLLWILHHFLINFYVIVEANNYFVESAVSGTQQHEHYIWWTNWENWAWESNWTKHLLSFFFFHMK